MPVPMPVPKDALYAFTQYMNLLKNSPYQRLADAVRRNDLPAVKALIAAGAPLLSDEDIMCNPPIIQAINLKDTAILKYFLSLKPDVVAINNSVEHACVYHAVLFHRIDALELLVAYGCDVNKKAKRIAEHMLAALFRLPYEWSVRELEKTLRLLINAKLDFNADNKTILKWFQQVKKSVNSTRMIKEEEKLAYYDMFDRMQLLAERTLYFNTPDVPLIQHFPQMLFKPAVKVIDNNPEMDNDDGFVMLGDSQPGKPEETRRGCLIM